MESKTLRSGLRFIHRQLDSPVVYVGIAIGVGTRHEKRGEYGLAHFTEHMLFKGTTSRSSKDIIMELEDVGGELNAYTGKEETILYALCPKAYAERALRLMADIVQNSVFAPHELEKEQTVVIDEIHSYEDSPSELIWDEFEDIVFKGHALGHAILGTEKTVSSFTQKKEQRFFEEHYKASNMAVFSQGDIDVKAFEALIEECFSHAPEATPQRRTYESPRLEESPRQITRRRDTSQRHVIIGASAYSMHDKRRLGLSLLVNILGGPGMSSRLNMSLREESGYAYNVNCVYTAYSDTGLVAINFGCGKQHVQDAIALTHQELKRITEEQLSEEELEQAKRQLKGQLTVASDGHENYFLSLGKAYLHFDKVEPLDVTMQRINTLQAHDLAEIAREIFPSERMYTLIYT